MEEPETDIDKLSYIKNHIDMAVDRSEDNHHLLHAMKEGRDPINSKNVGVSAYSRTEGDKPCFYTPSADDATSPSSPSSSSSKQMALVTCHSQQSGLAPLAESLAPTTRGPPSHLGAPSVGRAPSTVGKKSSKSVSRLCFPFVKKKAEGKSV